MSFDCHVSNEWRLKSLDKMVPSIVFTTRFVTQSYLTPILHFYFYARSWRFGVKSPQKF